MNKYYNNILIHLFKYFNILCVSILLKIENKKNKWVLFKLFLKGQY